jgi:hypothetical protein
VNQVHASLEGAHHASSGFVEHAAGYMVKKVAFELKIDDEVDMRSLCERRECPSVCQMLERPIGRVYQDLPWPL